MFEIATIILAILYLVGACSGTALAVVALIYCILRILNDIIEKIRK